MDTRVASSECEKGDEITLRPLTLEVSPEWRHAIVHSNFRESVSTSSSESGFISFVGSGGSSSPI